ncbi:MAG: DNA translocase FtsK [Lachnospiraceae bacterium]|nr:DNA translocase FtsK [Lachnospiraceae bacterium]
MAAKKKSSSRKKSSGRTTAKSSRKKSSSSRFPLGSEILLFAVLAFCIVLFIANIGKGGVVGNALSRFFFGLFGILSYAFPFALFFICAFLISNKRTGRGSSRTYSVRAVLKAFAGILFYVFLCVFAHMVYTGGVSDSLIYIFADSAVAHAGGGLVGGAIAAVFVKAFGIAAAYIIDIIVLILCVVLITERSLFDGISRGSRKAYESALEENRKRKASAAEKKRKSKREADVDEPVSVKKQSEKKQRRTDKNPETVIDFKLAKKSERSASDQISEVDMSQMPYTDAALQAADGSEDGRFTSRQTRKLRGRRTGEDEFSRENAEPDDPVLTDDSDTITVRTAKSRRKRQADTDAEAAGFDAPVLRPESGSAESYVYPDIRLLQKGDPSRKGDSRQHLEEMSAKLQRTLQTFGVNARVTNVVCGPAVTQYEVHPDMGVKVSKIINLADDIKLNLMVPDIRIEAPIPGKAAVGIEVPNKENVTVAFRDLIESAEFRNHASKISFCVGKDIAGNVIVADIAKMPHLLIAGATGSGKSVCINTIIMSILYKADPGEVKLIMIDPKVVELSVYNNIPHLLIPVVTDPKKAAGALHWAVAEMTERYNKFAEYGVRDMKGYNKKAAAIQNIGDENKPQKMAQIVVIVDELADLMMVAAGDVEDAICRLAQLARAAGIHLVIATQRPSVNVITGLIKANMPSRIAFSVTSGVDSRTILDTVGAEKLLGKGDMLFYPQGYAKPLRVQGAFVSDAEVSKVVDYIIDKNGQVSYNSEIEEKVKTSESGIGGGSGFTSSESDRDAYFDEAARFLIEKEKGSIGMLQRSFKIGFNRAARIMDQLEEAGIVGPEEGTKPRRILMTMETYMGADEDDEDSETDTANGNLC